jgi:ABC-type glycerol-3-phosphate transport system substrate-binding protein
MKFRKLLALLITCAIMFSLAAGCDGESPGDTQPRNTGETNADPVTPSGGENNQPSSTASTGDYRDLGGREIIIGIWWNPTPPGATDYGEARADYLADIQEKHNFTISMERIAGWGQMRDLAAASIIAGDPAASIFTFDSQHILSLFRQNLLYPVSSVESVDFNDPKWNQLVRDFMTFSGTTYGFADGYEPRDGLFFNKNVLSDAGIDPYSLYDMQRDNTWTWDEFLRICEAVTQDLDNDGITDIWAITSFHVATLSAAVISNGANFVRKDAEGRFYNASGSNEFLEAAQFVANLNTRGFVRPSPEGDGGDWDWFIDGFNEGVSAFRIAEEYAKRDINDGGNFEWGFVFFPRGPRATELASVYRENVRMVPAGVFEHWEVEDIMFAYDLYVNPPPGYEDGSGWKAEAMEVYRDRRAIDETLARMRTGYNGALRFEAYISGFETGRIAYNIWNEERTPAQLIEEAEQEWNVLIAEVNDLIFAANQ